MVLKLGIAGALALMALAFAFGLGSSNKEDVGEDAKVIAQLAAVGSNLSKPHPIEFFFYVPSRDGALKTVERLRSEEFEVEWHKSSTGSDWAIKATKLMVPAERELVRMRRDFASMLSTVNGDYDGWGTVIVQ